MPFRRQSRSRSQGSRRKARWEASSFLYTQTAATVVAEWARVPATYLDTLQDEIIPDDCTLVRVIANLSCQAEAADSTFFDGAAGLIAWDGISDAPPTEFPFPQEDAHLDWIIRWPLFYFNVPGSTNFVFFDSKIGSELFTQSKSKRKLSAGTGLLFVTETQNQDTAFEWDVRLQLLLP